MFGGGSESSSATSSLNFTSGAFNFGGSSDKNVYILAGVIVLLIIVFFAKGK